MLGMIVNGITHIIGGASPALQTILDPSVIWILIPLFALSIPIVAILTKPLSAAMKKRERDEARKSYERIAMEKLDVIKTAIAMGYQDDDLADLDARLKRLVGDEALVGLLDKRSPKIPIASADMMDADLASEARHEKKRRVKE